MHVTKQHLHTDSGNASKPPAAAPSSLGKASKPSPPLACVGSSLGKASNSSPSPSSSLGAPGLNLQSNENEPGQTPVPNITQCSCSRPYICTSPAGAAGARARLREGSGGAAAALASDGNALNPWTGAGAGAGAGAEDATGALAEKDERALAAADRSRSSLLSSFCRRSVVVVLLCWLADR